MIFRNALLIAAAMFALNTAVHSQINPELEEDLQTILDYGVTTYNLKGVEATLIFQGECRWTGVSGITDPSNTPVDTQRKWHWGSVGKAMTAAIVLQLDDEGLLDINDPIGDYLGVDTIPFLDGETTIKMLLNHTTDLNNSWTQGSDLWNAVWGDRDSVWNLWSVLEPQYRDQGIPNPDLVHNYVGYDNYLFLGFLVEQVTGELLETAYNERIFEPLGFTNSSMGTFGVNMNDLNGLYDGDDYRGDLAHNSYMSTRGGGGSYLGSSYDVARFIRAFHNDELVSSELMEEARETTDGTPAVVPGLCLGQLSQTYGYGTNIAQYEEGENTISFYGHGGNGLGNCLVFHNIENNFSIAVTTNDFSQVAQFGNLNLFMEMACYALDNLQQTECVLNIGETELTFDFELYPNPARKVLNIGTDADIDVLRIRDLQGRICAEAAAVRSINVEDLDSGLYVLEVESLGRRASKIWVKE